MRKFAWLTIGFALSCCLCTNVVWNSKLLVLATAFIVFGTVCAFVSGRKKNVNPLTPVLLGAAFGIFWFSLYHSYYLNPLLPVDGSVEHMQITVSDYVYDTAYSKAVDGTVTIGDRTYHPVVYLKDDMELLPGDILEGEFYIRVTTPEAKTESAYLQGNGLFLTLSQRGEAEVYTGSRDSIRYYPTRLAHHIQSAIDSFFPSDTAAFVKALLLGDTQSLTYQEDTALKISGIRHIGAVSGLHVSIVFGVLLFFFGRNRLVLAAVSAPFLFFFAAMTGFTPSVSRACVMTYIMVLGGAIFEEYDSLTGLAFACFVLLLRNPFSVKSVSFQLSVSSVAGILIFAFPINEWILSHIPQAGKAVRWIAATLSVSFSAVLMTTPISAYYFGTVSLVAFLTNLLTLWAVSIVFCICAMIALFGAFLPNLAGMAAWTISWLIRYVQLTAGFLASLPFAAVYTQSRYICMWLVLSYLLLACFFFFGRKHLWRYISLSAVALICAIALSIVIPRMDGFRMTVMDVGEGQCILMQSNGKYLLIDCGGNTDNGAADTASQTLLSQGVSKLDAIALTHFDRDHAGALSYLLSRVNSDCIYVPDLEDSGLIDSEASEKIVRIAESIRIPFGDGILTLTKPGNLKSANENCLCILFESEKCDILITGDRSRSGEKRLISSMLLPDVDVLIGGHHGSKYATSQELLDAVQPEIVIFSVGSNNVYGHPAQEVLDRVEQNHSRIFRTDRDGTIVVRRSLWRRNRFPMGAYSN